MGLVGWDGVKITFLMNRVMFHIKLKHITRRVQCNETLVHVNPGVRILIIGGEGY